MTYHFFPWRCFPGVLKYELIVDLTKKNQQMKFKQTNKQKTHPKPCAKEKN